jgi:hypothetical protein
MLKRSSEWVGLTKWASVGGNVGSEINGKSALFSRPVIIYKKLSHELYFVVPTRRKRKRGVRSFASDSSQRT